jgi:hypothetical protein
VVAYVPTREFVRRLIRQRGLTGTSEAIGLLTAPDPAATVVH